jgi:ABC-type Na+ efflux pump permease subunit
LARRAALAFAAAIERIDDTLRQWSSASLSLLVLVLLFGAAMLATR